MTDLEIEALEDAPGNLALTKAVADAMGCTDFHVFADVAHCKLPTTISQSELGSHKIGVVDVVNWITRSDLEAFVNQLLSDIDDSVEITKNAIALRSDDSRWHITSAYQLVTALLTVRKDVLYKAALRAFYGRCNYTIWEA